MDFEGQVRDITYAGQGFCPSAKRFARPDRRCSETSDVVTEWIPCYNDWDIHSESPSYMEGDVGGRFPSLTFEGGDARAVDFGAEIITASS